MLDGPLDPAWAENFNSVLDENRRLFLSSGENIAIPSGLNVFFETLSIDQAPPSIVSEVRLSSLYHPMCFSLERSSEGLSMRDGSFREQVSGLGADLEDLVKKPSISHGN